MCDSNEKVQKWTCDYCTYENFPCSIKCTMCKGAKPLLNEDIFRLSPPQTAFDGDEERGAVADVTDTDSFTFGTQNTHSNCNKWSCKLCTYLNWPRSLRCVQCCKRRGATLDMINSSSLDGSSTAMSTSAATNSARMNLENVNQKHKNSEENIDAANLKDELYQMRLNDKSKAQLSNNQENAAFQTNDVIGMSENGINDTKSNNSYTEDTPATNTTIINSNRISPNTTAQSNQQTNVQHYYVAKWACNLCTYENWPKSLKCSMCGEQRDMTSSNRNIFKENLSASSNNICTLATAASIIPTAGTFPVTNPVSSNKNLMSEQEELQVHRDTVSTNNSLNKKQNIYQLGSSETINNCDTIQERQERRQRQIIRQVDWQWLGACLGVVENNFSAVEAYLSCGGNPARALTSTEVGVLNRNSAFDVGHTLIHLAIRFHREEMLPMLLAQNTGSGPGIKRVPSYVAPDLAADIRRHFANTLRMRKTVFNCHYVQEHTTFALPAEIEELPIPIQEQLYDELLDRDAQKQLETPPPAINWSLEITARLGSRLLVLWNRSAGDCLLDSAMQATWGVFDRDNILRRALSDSLHKCAHM